MQNEPNLINKIQCNSYNFHDSFALESLKEYVQSDREITYLHYHNCIEIGYCYEGAGIFIIGNKILPFTKGDIVVIFDNQLHIAQSAAGNLSKWNFIFFDPIKLLPGTNINDFHHILTYSEGVYDFKNVISTIEDYFISQLFLAINDELEHKKDNYKTSVRSLVRSLLIKINRLIKPTENILNLQNKSNMFRIAKALEFISKNFSSSLKIQTLAVLCNMSITNFRRVFKETMGLPPLDYLIRLRIQLASVLLLDTDCSILDISLKVGYTSLSSFNRHFKKIMELTPREYRVKYT